MAKRIAARRTGASFNRHASKQDYETDLEFIAAVERRFGKLVIDLAGTQKNKKAPIVITPQMNSFNVAWHKLKPKGLRWLNPEFNQIPYWARKCREEKELGCDRIAFLTPAAVGSNWFAQNIWGHARVFALNGRLTFVGQPDPYPKDLMLSIFGMKPGFEIWRWKEPWKGAIQR